MKSRIPIRENLLCDREQRRIQVQAIARAGDADDNHPVEDDGRHVAREAGPAGDVMAFPDVRVQQRLHRLGRARIGVGHRRFPGDLPRVATSMTLCVCGIIRASPPIRAISCSPRMP